MFYSQFILAKQGPLGTIWIAAHLERKLRKNQVAETNIGLSVDSILFPEVPIALRLSGHLLLGVVRIYSKKVNYLFHDCSEALVKIKQAFHSTIVDLPPEAATAPYHSITLPETFDLDELELLPDPENSFSLANGNFVDHHVTTREQITLPDRLEENMYLSSQFGPDERFTDGDAPQMALDFDEDIFAEKVFSHEASPAVRVLEEDALPQILGDGDDANRMDIDEHYVRSPTMFGFNQIEAEGRMEHSTLATLLNPLEVPPGKAYEKDTRYSVHLRDTCTPLVLEARTPDLNQEFCPPAEPATPALPEETASGTFQDTFSPGPTEIVDRGGPIEQFSASQQLAVLPKMWQSSQQPAILGDFSVSRSQHFSTTGQMGQQNKALLPESLPSSVAQILTHVDTHNGISSSQSCLGVSFIQQAAIVGPGEGDQLHASLSQGFATSSSLINFQRSSVVAPIQQLPISVAKHDQSLASPYPPFETNVSNLHHTLAASGTNLCSSSTSEQFSMAAKLQPATVIKSSPQAAMLLPVHAISSTLQASCQPMSSCIQDLPLLPQFQHGCTRTELHGIGIPMRSHSDVTALQSGQHPVSSGAFPSSANQQCSIAGHSEQLHRGQLPEYANAILPQQVTCEPSQNSSSPFLHSNGNSLQQVSTAESCYQSCASLIQSFPMACSHENNLASFQNFSVDASCQQIPTSVTDHNHSLAPPCVPFDNNVSNQQHTLASSTGSLCSASTFEQISMAAKLQGAAVSLPMHTLPLTLQTLKSPLPSQMQEISHLAQIHQALIHTNDHGSSISIKDNSVVPLSQRDQNPTILGGFLESKSQQFSMTGCQMVQPNSILLPEHMSTAVPHQFSSGSSQNGITSGVTSDERCLFQQDSTAEPGNQSNASLFQGFSAACSLENSLVSAQRLAADASTPMCISNSHHSLVPPFPPIDTNVLNQQRTLDLSTSTVYSELASEQLTIRGKQQPVCTIASDQKAAVLLPMKHVSATLQMSGYHMPSLVQEIPLLAQANKTCTQAEILGPDMPSNRDSVFTAPQKLSVPALTCGAALPVQEKDLGCAVPSTVPYLIAEPVKAGSATQGHLQRHADEAPECEHLRSTANSQIGDSGFMGFRKELRNEEILFRERNRDGDHAIPCKSIAEDRWKCAIEKASFLGDETPSAPPKPSPFSNQVIDALPGDDDILATILGGGTPTFKVMPTPSENPAPKRLREAVRTTSKRQKIVYDASMMLHGDVIRQQLSNTNDIRRVQKKAPCTIQEIWSLQRESQCQQSFLEPLFPELPLELHELYHRIYCVNGVMLPSAEAVEDTARHPPMSEPELCRTDVNLAEISPPGDYQPVAVIGSIPNAGEINSLHEGSPGNPPTSNGTPCEEAVANMMGVKVVEPTEINFDRLSMEEAHKDTSEPVRMDELTTRVMHAELPVTVDIEMADALVSSCRNEEEIREVEWTDKEMERILDGIQPQGLDIRRLTSVGVTDHKFPENVGSGRGMVDEIEGTSLCSFAGFQTENKLVEIGENSIVLNDAIEGNTARIDEDKGVEHIMEESVLRSFTSFQTESKIVEIDADQLIVNDRIEENKAATEDKEAGHIMDASTICSFAGFQTENKPVEIVDSSAIPYGRMEGNMVAVEEEINVNHSGLEEQQTNGRIEGNMVAVEEEINLVQSGLPEQWIDVGDKSLDAETEGRETQMEVEKQSLTEVTVTKIPNMDIDISGGVSKQCQEEDTPYFPENIVDGNIIDQEYDFAVDARDTEFLAADDDVMYRESYDYVEARFDDNSGWSTRTRNVAKYLKAVFERMERHSTRIEEQTSPKLGLGQLLLGKTRKEAARMFFESLVLTTKDILHVEQQSPFDDIHLYPRLRLMKSNF